MDDRTPTGELPCRFLTLADTAHHLNIAEAHARELVRSGELRAIRVAGQWRVERAVLESFIEAMYEHARRMNLWHEASAADIAEPLFGSPRAQASDVNVIHISDYDMDRAEGDLSR